MLVTMATGNKIPMSWPTPGFKMAASMVTVYLFFQFDCGCEFVDERYMRRKIEGGLYLYSIFYVQFTLHKTAQGQ